MTYDIDRPATEWINSNTTIPHISNMCDCFDQIKKSAYTLGSSSLLVIVLEYTQASTVNTKAKPPNMINPNIEFARL